MIKIGDTGRHGNVWLQWLDIRTGERGEGFFSFDTLCELGYVKDNQHITELVVEVETVELGMI